MTKELVTIEFRYLDSPRGEWDSTHKNKTITIGVFDNLEEAIVEGNKALEALENNFEFHSFPDGSKAEKERFGLSNGCFNSPKKLITDLAYLKTPFSFFAKITKLFYDDIEETINVVLESRKRHLEYKLSEKNDTSKI